MNLLTEVNSSNPLQAKIAIMRKFNYTRVTCKFTLSNQLAILAMANEFFFHHFSSTYI
jgi:hypothetical protein